MAKLYVLPPRPVKRGGCTFSVRINGCSRRIRGENFEAVMSQIRALCPSGKLIELAATLPGPEAL